MKSFLCVTLGVMLLTLGCGGGEDETPSKSDFKGSKADSSSDPCKKYHWYGDGVCDDFCANPDPDCQTTCVEEGDKFEDFSTGGKCCSGLNPVPESSFDEQLGQCIGVRCPCFVCTRCGDGECGTGENQCNCPADCQPQTACVAEGDGFELTMGEGVAGKCCEGLLAVADGQLFEGECSYPRCPCFVCTQCGDGECGEGENVCNCKFDCDTTQLRCKDGSKLNPMCDMVPNCEDGLVPAIQNACFKCVSPETCEAP